MFYFYNPQKALTHIKTSPKPNLVDIGYVNTE